MQISHFVKISNGSGVISYLQTDAEMQISHFVKISNGSGVISYVQTDAEMQISHFVKISNGSGVISYVQTDRRTQKYNSLSARMRKRRKIRSGEIMSVLTGELQNRSTTMALK